VVSFTAVTFGGPSMKMYRKLPHHLDPLYALLLQKKFLVQYSLGVCVSHDSHQYVWHLSLLFFCPEQELPFDVLMTTYDIALMDQDFLSQIPWHYAVIDEAQRLKNPSSVSRHLIFVITWEF
jgi:hypothetical protein